MTDRARSEETGLRVVAYLRRSRWDDGYGLASQETEIIAWAARHEHQIVETFTDNGKSGTLPETRRPGLHDALQAVKEGRADGIVAHSQDRLARALHVQEAVLASVWEYGGRVFTVLDGEILRDDPDDPMRTFIRQVMAAVSELHVRQNVANMRRGKREKARQGGYVGGFSNRYGYRVLDGEYVPFPEEQEVIKRARQLRLKEGKTLQQIADLFNSEGVTTRVGGSWHPNSVRRIGRKGALHEDYK